MVEEKHAKHKITVHFECETLKSDEAAEDHLSKFMPKLVGMDAVGNYYSIFFLQSSLVYIHLYHIAKLSM